MKKSLPVLLALSLSACQLPSIYQFNIEQGNRLTNEQISSLHIGMSKQEVLSHLGSPVYNNIFEPNHWIYVHEIRKKDTPSTERVILIFENGRLREIQR